LLDKSVERKQQTWQAGENQKILVPTLLRLCTTAAENKVKASGGLQAAQQAERHVRLEFKEHNNAPRDDTFGARRG